MEERLVQLQQQAASLQTPAFVLDGRQLDRNIQLAGRATEGNRTRLFFAIDSFAILSGLDRIAPLVDGLRANSLFEVRLAREVLGDRGHVHVSEPGLRAEDLMALSQICDYISFNSVSQWTTYRERLEGNISCGLRVNPQLTLPKQPTSPSASCNARLGVALDQLAGIVGAQPSKLSGLNGILVHLPCARFGYQTLVDSVYRLEGRIGSLLERAEWIHLGGSCCFDESVDPAPMQFIIDHLQSRYDAEIILEPGSGISRTAGYLVSEVIDLFESDGRQVAVLDTSVNHLPEVFEYHFAPQVLGARNEGPYKYLLAGTTCLAGDLFGEYAFDAPLGLGSHIIFMKSAAYTIAKASIFNGSTLPAIYLLTDDGGLELKKAFTYDDYLSLCGRT